jgi:AcrR family transcriptional regulator
MGSKERLERQKENIKNNILEAAMEIVKKEGYQMLSMRKIADEIEYSAPLIYSYFLNKEAIEIELSRKAYTLLNNAIEASIAPLKDPLERFKTVILCFLEFTLKDKELYKLISATGMGSKDVRCVFPELSKHILLIRKSMEDIAGRYLPEEVFQCKYFTCVAMVHGLASANYYFKDISQSTNDKVIGEALQGMITSLKSYEMQTKTL